MNKEKKTRLLVLGSIKRHFTQVWTLCDQLLWEISWGHIILKTAILCCNENFTFTIQPAIKIVGIKGISLQTKKFTNSVCSNLQHEHESDVYSLIFRITTNCKLNWRKTSSRSVKTAFFISTSEVNFFFTDLLNGKSFAQGHVFW